MTHVSVEVSSQITQIIQSHRIPDDLVKMLVYSLTVRKQRPSPPITCFQATSSATECPSAQVPPTDPGEPGPVLQVDQLFCGFPAALTGVGPPAAAALQPAAQLVALRHVVPKEGAGEQVKRSPSTMDLIYKYTILYS